MSSLSCPSASPAGVPPAGDALAVVVFCAEWCGTCREFRPVLERLRAAHPQIAFSWVDIEDDAELVGEVEVESFPTLAIFRAGQPLYFGVSLPLENVVAQLLRVAATAGRPLSATPDAVVAFAERLRAQS